MEFFHWASDEVCATAPAALASLLRFAARAEGGVAGALACDEDAALGVANASAALFHAPPRALRMVAPDGVAALVLRRNAPAPPLSAVVAGGSAHRFAVAPPLPRGLRLDERSGALAGTPVDWLEPTAFTVR